VPLGIILKNENVIEEMIEIMLEIHEYVPVTQYDVTDKYTQCKIVEEVVHPILLSGDQLTRKRAEAAKELRRNSVTQSTQLKGLLPVCEDWHAKKTFLEVVWKQFYDKKSFMDKGSMCQLRNLINRRDISASVENEYNASDDFFNLLIRCHIIAAAMKYLGMKKVSDTPFHPQLPDELWTECDDKRRDILLGVAMEITAKYVNIDVSFKNQKKESSHDDKVQCYATNFLTHGLIYMEFSDSIREGDGQRILCCWRYLLLYFKANQRQNYSIEALNLLCQYSFLFTQRQAHQLIWSRCVNTHGIEGKNIPSDLYNEHLNRLCKVAVANLGPNKTAKAIQRIAKCVGNLSDLLYSYDKEMKVTEESGRHVLASFTKDKNIILNELLETDVFCYISDRQHKQFKNMKRNCISLLDENKVKNWMKEQVVTLRAKYM
jgi:L1 cell adhesion molecule like protein